MSALHVEDFKSAIIRNDLKSVEYFSKVRRIPYEDAIKIACEKDHLNLAFFLLNQGYPIPENCVYNYKAMKFASQNNGIFTHQALDLIVNVYKGKDMKKRVKLFFKLFPKHNDFDCIQEEETFLSIIEEIPKSEELVKFVSFRGWVKALKKIKVENEITLENFQLFVVSCRNNEEIQTLREEFKISWKEIEKSVLYTPMIVDSKEYYQRFKYFKSYIDLNEILCTPDYWEYLIEEKYYEVLKDLIGSGFSLPSETFASSYALILNEEYHDLRDDLEIQNKEISNVSTQLEYDNIVIKNERIFMDKVLVLFKTYLSLNCFKKLKQIGIFIEKYEKGIHKIETFDKNFRKLLHICSQSS